MRLRFPLWVLGAIIGVSLSNLQRSCSQSAPVAPALPSPPAALDYKPESLMPSRVASNAPLNAVEAARVASKAIAALKGTTNSQPPAAEPPRTPLYVIPEALVVQTPAGAVVFAPDAHVAELAKKFPATRLTNVVIWSRP